MQDGFYGISAVDTFRKSFKSVLAVVNCRDFDAFRVAAIVLVDDDVLRYVDKTTGKITRVSRFKSGIRQTFTSAVRRNEVFKNGKPFAVVCLDGKFDRSARRVGNESAHTCKLTNLSHVTTSAGVRHHPDGVEGIHFGFKFFGDFVGGFLPGFDNRIVAFVFRDDTATEVLFDVDDCVVGFLDDCRLAFGNVHIENACRYARQSRVFIAKTLDSVGDFCGFGCALVLKAVVDDLVEFLLAKSDNALAFVDKPFDFEVKQLFGRVTRYEMQILRNDFVENPTADGSGQAFAVHFAVDFLFNAHYDFCLKVDDAVSVSGHRLVGRSEYFAFAFRARAYDSKVIRTYYHILCKRDDRVTVRKFQNVVGGQHKDSGFGLRLNRQRYVDCHLVAVEVGVERAAGKRMKFDCATFDKDGFKRLNTKSVKRRSTVQKYGVILDDFFQNIPYLGFHRLHKAFRTLDVMADVAFHKFVHYERLKQLNSHFFGQTALIKFQFRSYDDNGTT